MSIQERLKTIRGKTKQKDFADLLGTSQSTVQAWEAGESIPGGKYLEEILKKYSININWLLTGEGDPYVCTADKAPEAASPSPISEAHTQLQPINITQSVSKLMRILGSGNQTLIRAIDSNLDAFSEAVDQKDEIRILKEQINQQNILLSSMASKLSDLETKLSSLESRSSSPGEAHEDVATTDTERKAG
jgi:transcriptional regulator with XRE-family HTH domain